MKISASVIGKINALLHTAGSPYSTYTNEQWTATDCYQWPIPEIPGQERNIYQRYSFLANQLIQISQENPNDPRAAEISAQLLELLKPYKPTYKCGVPVISYYQLLRDDPCKGILPAWWQARELVKNQPVSVFCSVPVYRSYPVPFKDLPSTQAILVVLPSADPYDFLRLQGTAANNAGYSTAQVIDRLKELDHQVGITIVNADGEGVEFLLNRKLSRSEASQWRKWLVQFCPAVEEPWESLLLGRIRLWWD